ncbi:DUF7511 domain-containing protein [Halosimplex salinum]|uniref:DUF7511 domain-containing protein n=1 Tax=Halosimplex salinum TaxID=1710538 RepID=UPI000F462859|nr:hypothetical protein [Halosimplex salinum]
MSTERTGQWQSDREAPTWELRAVVERYDDEPDQCTIYPAGVDDHTRMATWISATEPSFVELGAVR